MDIRVILPFASYFILIILIGFLSARFSSRGISEFFIGGRKLNYFVVALSAVVSGRSAWLLLGFVGQAYLIGLSAIWAVVGYIFVELFLFLFYAPRIRRFTEKHNCITVTDFFTARFDDQKGQLRILIVTIFVIFMVSYVAAQFVGGGKAFFTYFGIKQNTGLILTALIVLFYTILGGFLAVSLTDVLQAIIMLLALLGLPLIAVLKAGSFEVISSELINIDTAYFNPMAFGLGSMISLLGIGLGSPGNPHILVRYMSIKDPSQLKWSAIIGTTWNVLLAGGAFLIGIIARYYFPEASMLPDSDPENAFLALSMKLLPSALVGIILAAIFAAIMSTADSQLLVAASSLVRDFYQKFLHKNTFIPEVKLTFLSRLAVGLLVYLAVVMGLIVEDLVFWFVLFAWAGLGAAIGPTSILALFWKKTSKNGVIYGMIAGTLTVFIWKSSPFLSDWLYELIPGFLVGWITTYWVSLYDSIRKP